MRAHTHTHTAASHLVKPPRLQINELLPAGIGVHSFLSVHRVREKERERTACKSLGTQKGTCGVTLMANFGDRYIKGKLFIMLFYIHGFSSEGIAVLLHPY